MFSFEMTGPIIATIILAVVLAILVIIAIVKGQKRKLSAGVEDMVGKLATTHTALNPAGTVFAAGELWNAITEDNHIDAGTEVIITGITGLKLQVAKISKKEEKG
jgi:membrane-bound ClpP family serine protease